MLLAESTWKEIDGLDRETVVVVPFGAMEQHSLHLPCATDTIIGEALARRLDRELGGRLLVVPATWLGFSSHHADFAGTLTATSVTFIAAAREVLESIVRAGFRNILLLNAHGGNSHALGIVLADVQAARPDVRAALVTYWNVAAEEIRKLRETPLGGMGHACELETSLVLALRPDLVRRDSMRPDGRWPTSPFLHKDMLALGSVSVWRKFSETSDSGGHGDPTSATAEKGERFLQAITDRLAEVVRQLAAGELHR